MPPVTQDNASSPPDVEKTPQETPEGTDASKPEGKETPQSPEELEEENVALKKRVSELRTGIDEQGTSIKSLKDEVGSLRKFQDRFQFADEEPEAKEEDNVATKDDLALNKFEILNAERIALAQEEYDAYKEEGIKPTLALKLGLLDKGITDDKKLAEHLRQTEVASAPSAVDRSGDDPDEFSKEDRERAKNFQYDLETRKEHRDFVEGRKR